MEKNVGKIVQIIGPVLDIKFETGKLPNLLNAIEIEHEGKTVVCDCQIVTEPAGSFSRGESLRGTEKVSSKLPI